MRVTLALLLLLLPAAAMARGEMPAGPIPVHQCVQTSEGMQCSPVQDGAGFAAAVGYTSAYNRHDTTTSQQATSTRQGPEGPAMAR